jgi:hypothetical protein
MITIVGKRSTSFQPKDSSSPVVGTTFYYTEPLRDGEGCRADRFFLSTAKIKAMDYTPKIGDIVELHYNRWGKLEELKPVEAEIIE